jgi:type VI secretion system secreted protein Hcp
MPTGRRQYEPILIRKRIDKSSPLLFKAMIENQKIDALFRFYRPNPIGDGTTDQFFTVDLRDARIMSVKQDVLDTTQATASQEPPLEEVTFTGGTITWTFTNGGIAATDKTAP